MSDLPFDRLDEMAARLPFAIDDYDEAAAVFARWREGGREVDHETVFLWSYCYTLRYFYVRFRREPAVAASDVDAVIDRALKNVHKSFEAVQIPTKLPNYVSVVCLNEYRTYRRRCRPTEELDEERLAAPPEVDDFDLALVRWTIARVIEDLPPSLRPVARMRILEGASYPDVAEATGLALPTARTYYSKAIHKLQEVPDLQALAFDDMLPVGASSEEGGAMV